MYDWDDPMAEYYAEQDGMLPDGTYFADPGGESALRAETPDNPRNLPCPTCGGENRLTPADKRLGYQCDECARACELGIDPPDYRE